MEAVFEGEYAAFENKVKRSIYIDNLSPLVKESVIKAALDQFGNVIQVKPLRARPAVAEMFDDRPRKPDRTIMCYWLKSNDPDFEVATTMKRIVRNHAKEANFLLIKLFHEQLAKEQSESLNAIYNKYELVQHVFNSGTAMRLAKHYKMRTDVQHSHP
ncbi:hypothetical protein R3W88_011435 [Solanum pinnatisectum]|uniref:Uncharacterized protein n=1 Tax=Solanum pinnatisectum TaxID=50273 RepID=A0AAV9L794_9SOLN|nr:hypothetical protein R3W88_011435 [Solanum pinnatisectum]